MDSKNNLAYTIIEIIIVLAIISLLSSIIIPQLFRMHINSSDTRRIEDLHQIRAALELYMEKHGRYPNSLNNLVNEGFMSTIPKDPTANPAYNYQYATSSDAADFVLKAFLQGRDTVLDVDFDKDLYGIKCSKDDNASSGPYDYCIRP